MPDRFTDGSALVTVRSQPWIVAVNNPIAIAYDWDPPGGQRQVGAIVFAVSRSAAVIGSPYLRATWR
jgi:hypothetical protein